MPKLFNASAQMPLPHSWSAISGTENRHECFFECSSWQRCSLQVLKCICFAFRTWWMLCVYRPESSSPKSKHRAALAPQKDMLTHQHVFKVSRVFLQILGTNNIWKTQWSYNSSSVVLTFGFTLEPSHSGVCKNSKLVLSLKVGGRNSYQWLRPMATVENHCIVLLSVSLVFKVGVRSQV